MVTRVFLEGVLGAPGVTGGHEGVVPVINPHWQMSNYASGNPRSSWNTAASQTLQRSCPPLVEIAHVVIECVLVGI